MVSIAMDGPRSGVREDAGGANFRADVPDKFVENRGPLASRVLVSIPTDIRPIRSGCRARLPSWLNASDGTPALRSLAYVCAVGKLNQPNRDGCFEDSDENDSGD